MALRLLPFRQYDEHDVVNGYYLNFTSDESSMDSPDTDGINANGVLVGIGNGDLNQDTIKYTSNQTYLPAKEYSSPVGRNKYPYNVKYLAPVDGSSEKTVGITLNQTLKYDENGEPLQYRKQKLDELQAVLPLKPVPVATKGLFMFTANAFYTGHSYSVGTNLMASNNSSYPGKFQSWDSTAVFARNDKIGVILGTGSRAADDGYAGNYYLVKLDCT